MKYLLTLLLCSLVLSVANATPTSWHKPTEKVGLARAFELIGREANQRNIADMDFASVLQSDHQGVVTFKIELVNLTLGTQVDDPNVNLPKRCDLILIKYVNNVATLSSWKENGCQTTK